jgi:hypothetical protein
LVNVVWESEARRVFVCGVTVCRVTGCGETKEQIVKQTQTVIHVRNGYSVFVKE